MVEPGGAAGAACLEPDDPLRLVTQAVARDDPDPKALACYGLLVRSGDDAPEAL